MLKFVAEGYALICIDDACAVTELAYRTRAKMHLGSTWLLRGLCTWSKEGRGIWHAPHCICMMDKECGLKSSCPGKSNMEKFVTDASRPLWALTVEDFPFVNTTSTWHIVKALPTGRVVCVSNVCQRHSCYLGSRDSTLWYDMAYS